MTARRLVLGNWKMNTTLEEAVDIADRLRAEESFDAVTVGIAPPFPWLVAVKEALGGVDVLLGAQTLAATPNGAYTGEVSAAMVAELCDFALIGHSERRSMLGETDAVVSGEVASCPGGRANPGCLCRRDTCATNGRGPGAHRHRADQRGAQRDPE